MANGPKGAFTVKEGVPPAEWDSPHGYAIQKCCLPQQTFEQGQDILGIKQEPYILYGFTRYTQ
jgi:hypothetical protein